MMIKNASNKTLCEPRAFPTSGKVFQIPPSRIAPGSHSALGFHKTPIGVRGAEGVVIYKVEGTEDNLCIFYTVPYIGLNGFRLQWLDGNDVSATETLSDKMSEIQWEIDNEIKWHDEYTEDFKASGFMTQSDTAHMLVEVSNTD